MARTNVDVDEKALAWVMARYRFHTKRDAINYALNRLRIEPMSREEMLSLQGIGWEGDLEAMRSAERPVEI
jgi:Arc/MetJ family transcription regulator